MANQNIYSIFDRKAAAFMNPFYSTNDETAVRSLTETLTTNPPTHANDYELFHLGDFCDLSGTITPNKPTFIISVTSILANLNTGNMDSTNLDHIRDAFHAKMSEEEAESLLNFEEPITQE